MSQRVYVNGVQPITPINWESHGFTRRVVDLGDHEFMGYSGKLYQVTTADPSNKNKSVLRWFVPNVDDDYHKILGIIQYLKNNVIEE